MSTWLSGVIGQGIAANIGAAGCYGSNQHAAQQQAMMAQQAYGLQNMSQGQMAASPSGFGQGGFGQMFEPVKYMIDGKSMSFEEFVNTIYPADCAEKTMLILRLKRED